MKKKPSKTITLAEAAIVVSLFIVVSSIVIPEMSQANDDFRGDILQTGWQQLQGAVDLYRKEHGGRLPEKASFVAQLTLRSNEAGQVIPPAGDPKDYQFGPYLEKIPRNPYVNKRIADLVEVGSGMGGDQNAGWFFDTKTGDILPDHITDYQAN